MLWAGLVAVWLAVLWIGMRQSERRRIRKILREGYVDGEIQKRKDLARRISTPGG